MFMRGLFSIFFNFFLECLKVFICSIEVFDFFNMIYFQILLKVIMKVRFFFLLSFLDSLLLIHRQLTGFVHADFLSCHYVKSVRCKGFLLEFTRLVSSKNERISLLPFRCRCLLSLSLVLLL